MINKKLLLRTFTSMMCVITLASSGLAVNAAPSSKLEQQTSNLEGELSNLNTELSTLSTELDKAASQVRKLAEKIEKSKLDLAAAKLNEEAQYEAMSERIKFMYEGGNISLLHILFSSENMSDFLNKAEYVTTISDYDRNMLKELQNVRISVEEKQSELQEQQNELSELQNTLTAKESALKDKISSTSGKLSDYKAQLARAKAAEEALKQAQDAEISGSIGSTDSKPEKEEEKEETNKDTSDKEDNEDKEDNTNSAPVSVNDVALMAGILQCEAGGSYDGMLAVGTVIMNRVESSRFPNTLKGVIYQKGQFGPVSSGKLNRVLAQGPSSSAYSAAKEILGGKRYSKVKHCYFFNGSTWTDRDGINVGGNIFW